MRGYGSIYFGYQIVIHFHDEKTNLFIFFIFLCVQVSEKNALEVDHRFSVSDKKTLKNDEEDISYFRTVLYSLKKNLFTQSILLCYTFLADAYTKIVSTYRNSHKRYLERSLNKKMTYYTPTCLISGTCSLLFFDFEV